MFPAEHAIGDVGKALAAGKSVVLCAPPGSGKTTCIPPALLDEPWLAGKKIVMLEPRRMAARSCASYMSRRLGESVGGTVGYRVRLDSAIGPRTRLEIVTEGLLARRILDDPEINDVGLVIFDEFHERSLQTDFSFALALETKSVFRPDLRILVMSATLDADEIASHLPSPAVVRAEGRMFPVDTVYLGDMGVIPAVERACRETEGDILCFLPGEREIKNACEAVGDKPGFDVLPLYGALPKESQDAVFRTDTSRRRIVFSTSIAETSVTIPGITCVIDSGLMRVRRFSPCTGMGALETLPLSLDRAEQRRGRAGRVAPGICYRLWSEASERFRPAVNPPEILNADIAPLVLSCASWGAARREDLPWPTPPPAAAWDGAVKLLVSLGAFDAGGRISTKGRKMAGLSMHPRLAAMMLSATCAEDVRTASLLAAIMEEGTKSRETDVRRILDEVVETPRNPFSRRVLELSRRFERACAPPRRGGWDVSSRSEGALLSRAYPDRIAKSRGNGSFRMTGGRGAVLDSRDPLSKERYLVCCELDARAGDARILRASPVREDELEELFAEDIVSERICEWDSRTERVKCLVQRKLGAIAIGEKQDESPDLAIVAGCLVQAARSRGLDLLPCRTPGSDRLLGRLSFAARKLSWPAVGAEEVFDALEGFVSGVMKWSDLERVDLVAVIRAAMAFAGCDSRELDVLAPEKMTLPRGRQVYIDYSGEEPEASARLQEFFGMVSTPMVGGGKYPVVVNLLSPAGRPIQRTKDLAGFWRDSYRLVRKDMRGRYPKHAWPEDPLHFT